MSSTIDFTECPRCRGEGRVRNHKICPLCDGHGIALEREPAVRERPLERPLERVDAGARFAQIALLLGLWHAARA